MKNRFRQSPRKGTLGGLFEGLFRNNHAPTIDPLPCSLNTVPPTLVEKSTTVSRILFGPRKDPFGLYINWLTGSDRCTNKGKSQSVRSVWKALVPGDGRGADLPECHLSPSPNYAIRDSAVKRRFQVARDRAPLRFRGRAAWPRAMSRASRNAAIPLPLICNRSRSRGLKSPAHPLVMQTWIRRARWAEWVRSSIWFK